MSETDDSRRRATLLICKQFQLGLRSAEDACYLIIVGCTEPALVAEYFKLLPTELRSAIPECLAKMPVTEEEWIANPSFGMFDGNENSWAESLVQQKEGADAARAFLQGVPPPAISPAFFERARAARLAKMEEFRRNLESSRE